MLLLLSLLLVGRSLAQDITFGDTEDEADLPRPCVTVGGPDRGQDCQFPFIFSGVSRTGCITESDPAGRLWCSTRVDTDGVHVAGGDHWAHCSPDCPHDLRESGQTSSGDLSQSSQTSSGDLTVETSGLCFTVSGQEGTCRLAASCIGATIDDLEQNDCELSDGSPGTCCVPIPIDNIINIIDSPHQSVPLPGGVDLQQANDIFLRFGLNQDEVSSQSEDEKVRFASEEPADDVDVDVNFEDDQKPTEFHLRFNTPRADIVKLNTASNILLSATNTIKADNNLTDLQAAIGLRSSFNSETSKAIKERCPWVPAPTCNPNMQFRTFDGSCNNLKEPNMGRTGTPYQRILLPDYAKGSLDLPRKSSAGNVELPSARIVSNALSVGDSKEDSDNTILVMQMGQFIDHDITHTPNHAIQCCGRNGAFPRTFDAEKCAPIRMFSNDPFWQKKGKKTCMNFARSLSSPGLKCELSTREQLNQITHWIDGSNIYGSTVEEAMYLRSTRGKLKISAQRGGLNSNLPSCQGEVKGKVTGCDVCGSKKNDCFFAGDFRVNEQLNLIVLHTLFMREHNRIAIQLATINPRWSDDKIYQEARRINIAEYQHIIFKEWLPIIIGNTFMKSYGLFPRESGFSTDYSDNFDTRINNEFAGAAFRFGHSMVPSNFRSVSRQRSETLQMSQQFFSPDELKSPGFLDGLVRGMTKQGGQLWDNKFVEDLRNHLFESRPGRGGLDLVAVNIQRGRDHGLPGYNMYREICTGSRAKDWPDLRKSMEPRHIEKLKEVYRNVDDIDLYVGGFLEAAHEDSILGPVFKCIIGDQFARLKKGDRFFYDLGLDKNLAFSLPQLNEVRKTSMARIICDNTDEVDSIQPLAFKMPTSKANAVRSCSEESIPTVNLKVFKSSTFGR